MPQTELAALPILSTIFCKLTMASKKFSLFNFLLRIVAAAALVVATYNPLAPNSFYHWAVAPALQDYTQLTVLHGFVAVVLLIGWVIFLRATISSLGVLGMLLAIAFFGMLIWLIVDQGWINMDNPDVLTWLIIAGISGVLGTGMSWSLVRRRISGQLDVDETDE